VLHAHAAAAGPAAAAPAQWPADAGLARDRDRPTLLLFVHPGCPCTAATLEELNRLLARCAGRARVEVLFRTDPALGPEAARTGLWAQAAALPGVTVTEDPLGALAQRFGARTSGQACLYDRDGTLRYSGGLTPSRGHAGDNGGRAALQALLLGDEAPARAPVFGCLLHDGDGGA
jgi:hypothetical protein